MNDLKQEEKENIEEDVEPRLYELGFLLLPLVEEEKVQEELDGIKKIIQEVGGVFSSEKLPRKIELAYEIAKKIDGTKKKFKNAYFGWVRFEMNPSLMEKIKEEMDKHINTLRYILILVDKESLAIQKRGKNEKTIIQRKKPEEFVKKPEEKENKKEKITKEEMEELDKTIDDIVEGSEDMADKARSTD